MIYQICEHLEVLEVKRANSRFIVLMQWLKNSKKNKQQPFESKSNSACVFHNYASHGTDEC